MKKRIERICKTCSRVFYVVPSRLKGRGGGKYCSIKCRGASKKELFRGQKSPLWNSKKCKCVFCGKEFYRKKSWAERKGLKFCSVYCKDKYHSQLMKGHNHPRWKSTNTKCRICGKRFHVKESRLKKARTCSKKCSSEWKSKTQSGENNPAYIDGSSKFPYPLSFNRDIKEEVRNLFYRKCAICNKPEEENNKRLEIHHIDRNKENLSLNNLIALCKSCHVGLHNQIRRERIC